jgi:basic amino acid/polyamine antiporter, APA family
MSREEKFAPGTAAAVVIANMIGTGVFTTLGFQLLEIRSGFALIMLWVIGGITALCGALSYAELGAAMPRSGGEYNFLSRTLHPMAGFISGWVSATIGFAGPTALAALTFGIYLSSVMPSLSALWLASGLIIILAIVHSTNRKTSAGLQQIVTILKIALIGGFSFAALYFAENLQPVSFVPASEDLDAFKGGAFAVALIYVNYAYSGWNAATYLSGELERPQKNLPRVLFFSTAIVMVLYVLLNFVFLSVAPMEDMAGKVEIGYVAAQHAFGNIGASLMGVMLGLLLISTVSAMTMAGPRVLQMIGEDFTIFRRLGQVNSHGVPATAIYFQSAMALVLLWTASFESILVFAGATLALNTFVTVIGLFLLRLRLPEVERPYKTWAYPLPPIIFLIIVGWTLVYTIANRPVEALFGAGVIVTGILFYLFSTRAGQDSEES